MFPGAPVNPTELLIPLIAADRPLYASSGLCDLHTAVLAVEYERVPVELARLSASSGPFDIARAFRLAGGTDVITLEHVARNETRPSADAAGFCPPSRVILPGGDDHPSTLPLREITNSLEEAGVPFTSSQDAGGYLCNYVFYVGRAGTCPGFRPPISGFVHVPPLDRMPLDQMKEVARIVIEQSCLHWRKQTQGGVGA